MGRGVLAAIFLHFSSLRLASMTSLNASFACAHFHAATAPTPPAPITRTFAMDKPPSLLVLHDPL